MRDIRKYIGALIWMGIDRATRMNVYSVNYLSVYQNWHKEKEAKQSLAGSRQFILNDLGYHVKFNYSSSPVSLDLYELLQLQQANRCHNSDTKIQ